ncbi:hypothetical protein FBU59_007200 [Linderina macrospora]|uniref:Uncharacterized protein n=1 Tax=Linderina macrospora TaxID=4868 RepID=A0ACC1IXT1_9FUNG|nr:hypothetical protein FBU59_007200 [Linderina macrospora]
MISSFAEQQLAKYGWKQGEGLGKEKTGIKRAITVSRRTDNRGIGSDASQWTSNWWDHLYNKASGTSTPQSEEDPDYTAKLAEAATQRDTLADYKGMFVKSTTDTPRSQSGASTPKMLGGPVDRTQLGMPRPEVAAMIEAALRGEAQSQIKAPAKRKRDESERVDKKHKEKKLKKDKKEKKEKNGKMDKKGKKVKKDMKEKKKHKKTKSSQ